METADILEICRQSIFVLLKMAAPLMLIALVVGLIISLFQALTQIQEMTLTFVPKIVAIFMALLLLMPFMLESLITFTHELQSYIIAGEARKP